MLSLGACAAAQLLPCLKSAGITNGMCAASSLSFSCSTQAAAAQSTVCQHLNDQFCPVQLATVPACKHGLSCIASDSGCWVVCAGTMPEEPQWRWQTWRAEQSSPPTPSGRTSPSTWKPSTTATRCAGSRPSSKLNLLPAQQDAGHLVVVPTVLYYSMLGQCWLTEPQEHRSGRADVADAQSALPAAAALCHLI